MSGIFDEILTFKQENGPDVRLVVMGDEHYAHYETIDGYTVVYDADLGLFCYALLINGRFVSSSTPISAAPPAGLRRHLEEAEIVRQEKFNLRHSSRLPPVSPHRPADTFRTLGPNNGLLTGRRVSTGRVRGLTVIVEFQDVTTTITRADVEEMLNGANYTRNGNFCSARDYFLLVSSGKLDYTNTVVGPIKLSRNQQFYVTNLLVRETMDLVAASGIDLSQFDSRGEGIIDAVNILYAGQSRYEDELWPHNSFIDLQYGTIRTYFYLLTGLGNNPADLSIGTFCHENGHLLCRFPDMYDYGNRDGDGVKSAGIGSYCLMGSGNHNNRGRTPSPVCGYLRDLAGWCDNIVDLGEPGEKEARHSDYRTLMKYPTDKINEYFIVENRSKRGLDQHIPSSGLAVYHCDTLGSNEFQEGSSTRHYQCGLLQADGKLELERNINPGDGGDLYGAISGTVLSHATSPSSRQWDNVDSGLILHQISAPGEVIKFITGQPAELPGVGIQPEKAEAAPDLTIPDDDPTGIGSALAFQHTGTVRQIKLSLEIKHTYIGDLRVELLSPTGRRAIIHAQTGGSSDNIQVTLDSGSPASPLVPLVGQPVQGNWVLRVTDLVGQDVGKLKRWSLELTPEH